MTHDDTFSFVAERFAEFGVLRIRVPNFAHLTFKQKLFAYFLSQAALSGRDITWDQNYKHNLLVRHTLEAIVETYRGDRTTETFGNFMTYVKRVWMNNGIHQAHSADKMYPAISEAYFASLVRDSDPARLPSHEGEVLDVFTARVAHIIFDTTRDTKKVVRDSSVDIVAESAVNFYEGVTQKEVEAFYENVVDADPKRPVSHGLNSKMVKQDGVVHEVVWKVGGMYSPAIERIVYWLTRATDAAETDMQRQALEKLIEYYTTGDLHAFDEYSILWARETTPLIDTVSGFIEVYDDPLARRGTYEMMVSVKSPEATQRVRTLIDNVQWFEDNSPIDDAYKRSECHGMAGSGIFVIMGIGDMSPIMNIGQNLPNAEWIREEHGSKSVTLENVVEAQDEARRSSGILEEFAYSDEEIALQKEHGLNALLLHIDMHEVIGHGSGKLKAGADAPSKTLREYYMALEEARADLVGLYYGYDQKLVDIGIMKSLDVGKAEYNRFVRNALMVQLQRVEYGKDLEEAHMRNRQLIAAWCYEKGKTEKVIERKVRNGKTYFVINDHDKLRDLFGQLLREIQRIKSEGDYEAGRDLVETYGVKVDRELHKEVLERWKLLNVPSHYGVINPKLTPVISGDEIVDITISYPTDFTEQMLEYGREYALLPVEN